MIRNQQEYEANCERIRRFQQQVEKLRAVEHDSQTDRMSAGGFLAEIERMKLEAREYLWLRSGELWG